MTDPAHVILARSIGALTARVEALEARLGKRDRKAALAAVPEWIRPVVRDVAERHGLTPAELLSDTRIWRISHARQEVMHIAIRKLHMTYPQVGRALGMDHSSIIHGVQAHERRLAG